jgi:hypothetical protein
MTTLDKIKALTILISGFLTIILMNSFPVDGGGISLIFVLTVPFLIVLSLGLAVIYSWKTKKRASTKFKNIFFSISLLVITTLTFLLFPCSDNDSPCPCQIILNSIKVSKEYNQIQYKDLFLESKKSNYPKIVAAQKKFKNKLPEKFFYVTYSEQSNFNSLKKFVIYFKNNNPNTDNADIDINNENNELFTFYEFFRNDTIVFKSAPNGFNKVSDFYKNSPKNSYGYYETNTTNYKIYITEGNNEIKKHYWFYKLYFWIL